MTDRKALEEIRDIATRPLRGTQQMGGLSRRDEIAQLRERGQAMLAVARAALREE